MSPMKDHLAAAVRIVAREQSATRAPVLSARLSMAIGFVTSGAPYLLHIDTMPARYRLPRGGNASKRASPMTEQTHGNPGDSLFRGAGRYAQLHARGRALQRVAASPDAGDPAPGGQARWTPCAPGARQHAPDRARPHHAPLFRASGAAAGTSAQT